MAQMTNTPQHKWWRARDRMQNWHWTDIESSTDRWRLFKRSGEGFSSLVVIGWALVLFFYPGESVARVPSLALLSRISDGRDLPWAIIAFVAAAIPPLALLFDNGRLRIFGLFAQAVLYIFLAASAVAVPYSILWTTFLAGFIWTGWRMLELLVPRLVLFGKEVAEGVRDRVGWLRGR